MTNDMLTACGRMLMNDCVMENNKLEDELYLLKKENKELKSRLFTDSGKEFAESIIEGLTILVDQRDKTIEDIRTELHKERRRNSVPNDIKNRLQAILNLQQNHEVTEA